MVLYLFKCKITVPNTFQIVLFNLLKKCLICVREHIYTFGQTNIQISKCGVEVCSFKLFFDLLFFFLQGKKLIVMIMFIYTIFVFPHFHLIACVSDDNWICTPML